MKRERRCGGHGDAPGGFSAAKMVPADPAVPTAPAAGRRHRGREFAIGVGLAVLLAFLVIWSLTIGAYDLTFSDAVQAIGAQLGLCPEPENAQASTVLLVIRLPRVLLTALVGAALAVSGAAYQGMFKNPMVAPDILGVSSGAGTGAAFAILLGLGSLGVQISALLFGLGAVGIVMLIARAFGKRGNSLVIMILAGTVMSSVFSALTSLAKYLADPDDKLPEITYWLMGSFARSGVMKSVVVMGVALLVGGGLMMLMRWRINVMAFGEEEARTMGVNVRATRNLIVLAATMLTSVAVCLCGTIGWVGLIIPHIMRLATGPNYQSLIPLSMLAGACFMVVVDDLARSLTGAELPVGILTALIGAPLFIYMLVKGRREWL